VPIGLNVVGVIVGNLHFKLRCQWRNWCQSRDVFST